MKFYTLKIGLPGIIAHTVLCLFAPFPWTLVSAGGSLVGIFVTTEWDSEHVDQWRRDF